MTDAVLGSEWEEVAPDVFVRRDRRLEVDAVLVVRPTTEKLRAIRLRELSPPRSARLAAVAPFEPRRSTESPGDFYARVRAAHGRLAANSQTPTSDLAALASVPVGTAAVWVHRAKRRAQ